MSSNNTGEPQRLLSNDSIFAERLTIRPESSASTEDSIPPNLNSLSQFPEARTSALIATTPIWSDSPLPKLGQNDYDDYSFSDSNLRPSTLSVDATTPQISTRLTYSAPQTQNPETLPARPKSGVRALALDLPKLPESSESLPLRLQSEDHADRITDCPIPLSVVKASTAGSASSKPASLQSSLIDSERGESEDVSSSSSGPNAKQHLFSFFFDILALESSHRAKTRESRIRRIIKLLIELRNGTYVGAEPVIRRKLSPSQFQEFRTRVEADASLSGFFNDKLR